MNNNINYTVPLFIQKGLLLAEEGKPMVPPEAVADPADAGNTGSCSRPGFGCRTELFSNLFPAVLTWTVDDSFQFGGFNNDLLYLVLHNRKPGDIWQVRLSINNIETDRGTGFLLTNLSQQLRFAIHTPGGVHFPQLYEKALKSPKSTPKALEFQLFGWP